MPDIMPSSARITCMDPLLDRITINPNVCFGKPCTRIWVSLIIDFLAAGDSQEEILAQYPQRQPDDIRAALAYAVEIARERIVPVPLPAVE
jgi:uncharacterized protein (DUF433 family)